jgi:CheY-like chemotaxis protein
VTIEGMHGLPPILLAEDNEDDFFHFRRSLRAAGVENPLLRFRDGSELVRYLEALPANAAEEGAPWLLFLDLGMPLMDGFEVLEWLKQKAMAEQFTPIVLSGSYAHEAIKRSFALGASEFLVKPIAPAFLAAIAARPRMAMAN